jgi:hypothetical protein
MPTMPTIDVTQAQADRALAAFGSVANYKRWLADSVRDFVVNKERQAINLRHEQQRQAEIAQIEGDMAVTNP